MSFSEIRDKDVINIRDGRNLGKPIDLILNENACVEALVVPGTRKGLLSFLRPNREGRAIDWHHVRRIGDDVIIVDVEGEPCGEEYH